MEYLSNVSSEEELSRLRRQGKITEGEYGERLGAMGKSATESARASSSGPEFEAFRKRVLTYSFVVSIIGLPVGIAMNLPYVWGLSIAGIIVGGIKLSGIKNSWLAKIVHKNLRRR
jgi:hypothetical protein